MLVFSQHVKPALGYLISGLVLVSIIFWGPFQSLPEIIQRDTIWHLSPGARVMLVTLASCASMAIALFCLVKTLQIARFFSPLLAQKTWQIFAISIADFIHSLFCLWVALGLAPQLFYALYVAVIPGLPGQWVVDAPSWIEFINLTKLSKADTLSSVVSGVLLWSTMLATGVFWAHVFVKKPAIESP